MLKNYLVHQSEGYIHVALQTVLLQANSNWCDAWSQCFNLLSLIRRIRYLSIRFVPFICQSVWVCIVFLLFSNISSIFYKIIQKWLRNLMLQSEVIILRTLYKCIASWKKILAISKISEILFMEQNVSSSKICQPQQRPNLIPIMHQVSLIQNTWIYLSKYHLTGKWMYKPLFCDYPFEAWHTY